MKKRKIKVVLDTNMIVSATLIQGSIPDKILKTWRDKKFELVTSLQILEELGEVLFYNHIKDRRWATDQEVKELLLNMENSATLAQGLLTLKVVEKDPDDDKFIIAAVEEKAHYLVTGNKHVLDIKEYQGVKIISPAEFLKIIIRK